MHQRESKGKSSLVENKLVSSDKKEEGGMAKFALKKRASVKQKASKVLQLHSNWNRRKKEEEVKLERKKKRDR